MKKSRHRSRFSKSSIARQKKRLSQGGIPLSERSSKFIRMTLSLLISSKTIKAVNTSKPLRIILKQMSLRKRRFVKHIYGLSYSRFVCPKFFHDFQVYIDEKLTKKTSKAIRTRIDDLLPEKTDSKKPRLMEPQNDGSKLISADSKINQGPHNSCSSISDDPSSKSNLEEGNKAS